MAATTPVACTDGCTVKLLGQSLTPQNWIMLALVFGIIAGLVSGKHLL